MSYRIVRYYQDDTVPAQVIATGLSHEEAVAHCEDPETSSSTATSVQALAHTAEFGPWFDGHEDEGRTEEDDLADALQTMLMLEVIKRLLDSTAPGRVAS